MDKNEIKKQFEEGLLSKNPVLVQLLGMCSTLAITTSLFNGLGMGISVTLILICSNVLISALRKIIPSQIRIAAYIVIIAGFVTIVDLMLQAFLPDLAESLTPNPQGKPYTTVDLYARLEDYELVEVLSLPGENVRGEEYMEYHIDEEKLDALILDMLYSPKNK